MISQITKYIKYTYISIPKFLWPENIRKEALKNDSASNHDYRKARWLWLVIIMLLQLSISTWCLYYLNGLTLSYNDARSHLDVARRVVDSLQPGFAQIGSVWLPLQHILELPTIWNDFMFRTGLSGSLVSMISFVLSGIFIWKIIKHLNLGVLSALIGVTVFSLNPNILFLQTTPMTELLMLATTLGSILFFIRWVKYDNIQDLVISSFITFLTVLTRYDGWFTFAFLGIACALISYIKYGEKKAEANFVIYTAWGFFGIVLWLGWNYIIFGNALFFLSGPYSAKAQQDVLSSQGTLLTNGHLSLSIYTYLLTIKENVGAVLFVLGGLGFAKALFSKINFTLKLALLVFLVPIFFNILSLYLGESAIHLPQLPPYTWFNDRYGIMALPAVAIGTAFLISKRKLAVGLIIIVVLLQTSLMYINNNIITIQDAVRGSSGYFLDDIGSWLHMNTSNGLILAAASSNDALIFKSGLPLNHFITEGAEKYWKESLVDPTKYAKYVIMHKGDLVYSKLYNKPIFTSNYTLVYQGQFADVYKENHYMNSSSTLNKEIQ